MQAFTEQLRSRLAERETLHLTRRRKVLTSAQGNEVSVDGRRFVSFCSNDYLGLANHPDVVQAFHDGLDQYGAGSGASHLISGHSSAHHALEEELAEFTGRSRALTFSSGFMANVGVITTLAGNNDQVFEDKLNHASLLDGGLFSGARFQRYSHLDSDRLRTMLEKRQSNGNTFIVSDGVFSMDGDKAPLPELIRLAASAGAQLMIDDAHGFGCLGRTGGGLVEEWRERGCDINEQNLPVLVGTLGKAFGTSGAFVAGSDEMIETLIQFCRPYIYTTAMPPAVAHATRRSLEIVREESWRRDRLTDLVVRFRAHCESLGLVLTDSATPIQSVLLGDPAASVTASAALEREGILVSAIRPPTVPPGTSRLRITFSASHSEDNFARLLKALEHIAAAVGSPS